MGQKTWKLVSSTVWVKVMSNCSSCKPAKGQGQLDRVIPTYNKSVCSAHAIKMTSFCHSKSTIELHSSNLISWIFFSKFLRIKNYFIIYFIYLLIWWYLISKILPCVSYMSMYSIWFFFKILCSYLISIWILHNYMHDIVII